MVYWPEIAQLRGIMMRLGYVSWLVAALTMLLVVLFLNCTETTPESEHQMPTPMQSSRSKH